MLETQGPSQEIIVIYQHLSTTCFSPEIKHSDRSKILLPQVIAKTKTRKSFFLQSDQTLEQYKYGSSVLHVGKYLEKELKATLPPSETFFFYSLNLRLIMVGWSFWP